MQLRSVFASQQIHLVLLHGALHKHEQRVAARLAGVR
jgi:hypothetical protein